jgi:hypothetical protein
MVWDNNSNQIVVLNSDETETCEPYWLPLGETMKCDSFTVMLREENFDMDFVLRDFLLQSIDEDYEFNCRMITACYWPDSCTPIKTAFELVNKVKMFRLQSLTCNNTSSSLSGPMIGGASGSPLSMSMLPPLIVHDLCGSHRAATFCALYTFQDLIHLENSVNVYETAKMFHLKRPGLWSNKANIMFLYGAVEYLFDEMHANNQYQFRNYLNLNIDNHFHNLLYSSHHHYYNNNHNSGQNQPTNTNHVSLTLLPSLSSSKTNANSAPIVQQTTVTLPNIATTTAATLNQQQTNKQQCLLAPPSQQRNLSINETIGTRLHNFQNHIQQARVQSVGDISDPSTTIPLTSANIQVSKVLQLDPLSSSSPPPPLPPSSSSNILKTSLIELPRILPSFFANESKSSSSHLPPAATKMPIANRRSTSANYRNNKAIKFMNTMRMKSVSFKRALFPNSTPSQNKQPQLQQQQQQQQPSYIQTTQQLNLSHQSLSAQHQQQQQAVEGGASKTSGDTTEGEIITNNNKKDDEMQKAAPVIGLSLSSGSSSATTSSSSTALSSTPMTATESISFKSSAFVSANQIISAASSSQSQAATTSLLNNLNNGNKSLSREKLT